MTEYSIVYALNFFASSHPIFAEGVSLLASDSAFFLVGALFYFWFKTRKPLRKVHRDMLIVAVSSGLIARFLLKICITSVFRRPRPYVAYPDIVPLIQPPFHEEYLSFPSGHALFFFAVSTVVYIHHRKLGILFYFISSFMVFARVIAGVHYISDVFAGAVVGVMTALLFMKITKKVLPI